MIDGKIGILEVGGGKSEAFNLAFAYWYKKGDTNLLYTTSSKDLTYRDAKEKLEFLNQPAIRTYLFGKAGNLAYKEQKSRKAYSGNVIDMIYIEPGTTEKPGEKAYKLCILEDGTVVVENKNEQWTKIKGDTLTAVEGEDLDYNIFMQKNNRLFFAQQENYSYLKQRVDKGEIKGDTRFTYLVDEADYVVNKPTEYTTSEPEEISKEKKAVIELIQEYINLFNKEKDYDVDGKSLKFHRKTAEEAIKKLKEKIRESEQYKINSEEYENIMASGDFKYMIESALNANYVQTEGDDYIVREVEKKETEEEQKAREKAGKPRPKQNVIQIKGDDGFFQDPNVKNAEDLHLAILAYQEAKAKKEGKKLSFEWEGSKTKDKENIFGFLNWDRLNRKCLATGTDSPSLKEIGDVVKLPTINGAKDVKVGLYVEETEQAKKEKIDGILKSFFGKNKINKTAFIFEADPIAVENLKEYLKGTKEYEENDILVLDGKNGETFEKNKAGHIRHHIRH